MFPYGMGWPGYQPMPNQQSEVDWGSLARQWMQQKAETDQSVMWDPSIPPPTYIPPPPPMSIPPPPILERPPCHAGGMPAPMSGTMPALPDGMPTQPVRMSVYPSPAPPPPPPPPPPAPRPKSPTRSAPPLLPDPPAQQPWLMRKQPSTEPEVTNDLKKKRLPAWIREGLEKIEQEKNKKMQEKVSQENQVSVIEDKSHIEIKKVENSNSDDLASQDVDTGLLHDRESSRSSERPDDAEKSDDNYWAEAETACHRMPREMSAEEKLELKMTVLRRFMTDLLLSVTNTEMKALIEAERSRMERLKEDQPKRLAESAALSSLAKEDSSLSETSASSRSPASLRKNRKVKSAPIPSEDSGRCSKTRSKEISKRDDRRNSPPKKTSARKETRTATDTVAKRDRSVSSRHRSRSPMSRRTPSRSPPDGGKRRRNRRRRTRDRSSSGSSRSKRSRHRSSRHRAEKRRGKAAASTGSESSS